MARPPARSAGERSRRSERHRPLALGIALLVALLAAPALLADPGWARDDPGPGPTPCLRIERITAFAPRGEVYVELDARCGPRHFVDRDSLLAYVEVLPSDLPPVGEDVRVFEEQPRGRTTLVFRNLSLTSGDVVLVRLLRLGEILGLQSVRVP